MPVFAVFTAAAGALTPLFVRQPAVKRISSHSRNWMSVLSNYLPLSAIAIPGSHDSGAKLIPSAVIARCQSLSIPAQLEAGARFLDIRLCYKNDDFFLVHGRNPCLTEEKRPSAIRFESFCAELSKFLKENPTETVLVSIKQDSGVKQGFAEALYEKYLSHLGWFMENRIPTLGEVRGKAVLLRRFEEGNYPLTDENGGLNLSPSLWKDHGSKTETGYVKFGIKSLEGKPDAGTLCLQDCYGLAPKAKWHRAFQPLMDRGICEGEMMMNFLSCTGMKSPTAAAVILNHKFMENQSPMLSSGGIYIFDFLDAPLAEKVYSANQNHKNPQSEYPKDGRPLAPSPDYPISRWLSGYSHLLFYATNRWRKKS